MSSRPCLVLHRRAANESVVADAVASVRRRGIDLRVRIPWDEEDLATVVEEALAGGATRIVAGGGDGTLNAVGSVLVGTGAGEPPASLGLLPLGTANDFARGCGLPVDDLPRCLEIACTGAPRRIDVGRANGRIFLNVASGGFGAEVTAATPAELKNALGGAAYTIMGMVKALRFQPAEARLLLPGEEPVEGAVLFLAVGNNRFAGGGFEVAPDARLDDGLLDLVVWLHEPGTRWQHLLQEIRELATPGSDHGFTRQLAEFVLESEREIHFNLDGEPLRTRRLELSVLPRHLPVVTGEG